MNKWTNLSSNVGNVKLIDFLGGKGVNFNANDNNRKPPLWVAIKGNGSIIICKLCYVSNIKLIMI